MFLLFYFQSTHVFDYVVCKVCFTVCLLPPGIQCINVERGGIVILVWFLQEIKIRYSSIDVLLIDFCPINLSST